MKFTEDKERILILGEKKSICMNGNQKDQFAYVMQRKDVAVTKVHQVTEVSMVKQNSSGLARANTEKRFGCSRGFAASPPIPGCLWDPSHVLSVSPGNKLLPGPF